MVNVLYYLIDWVSVVKSVETVYSNSGGEVQCTSDTEADRAQFRHENRQAGQTFYD